MLKKISAYHWFGMLGVLFWLADTYSKIFYIYLPQRIFWFCSLGLLIVLIGYFRKKSFILTTTLCLLFVIEALWMLTVFLTLLSMGSFYPFTDISKYVFAPNYSKIRLVITMYHFLIIPLILVGLHSIKKVHKYGWLGAILLMNIFLWLGYFFPDVVDNTNCSLNIPGDACNVLFGSFYKMGLWQGYLAVSLLFGIFIYLPINYFAVKYAEKNNWKVEKKIKI